MVSTVTPPVFPFTGFADMASKMENAASQEGSCVRSDVPSEPQPTTLTLFEYQGKHYGWYLTGSRWVLVQQDADDEKAWVWFGKTKLDAMEVEFSLPYNEAVEKFPSPCDYLLPLDVK